MHCKPFLYYLAAIGSPNLKTKIDILSHNLNYLYENIKIKFDIMLNLYDIYDEDVLTMLKTLPFIENIIIHRKVGILAELYLTNPHHNLIDNYEYIFFLLF